MTAATTIDYTASKLDAESLAHIVLLEGSHQSREHGLCVMEAAAWLAGEPHSDTPQCASPLVTRFAQRLNDRFGQNMRDSLRDRLPLIVGSRGTPEVERRRNLELVYLLFSVRFAAVLEALAAAPRVAEFKDRLMSAAATLRALTREDGPGKWRAAAAPARATEREVWSKYPSDADADAYAYAYADAHADADAYADAYGDAYADAYAKPSRRAELKAAMAKDALAMLDAILAIKAES